jgi:hypothetical protein
LAALVRTGWVNQNLVLYHGSTEADVPSILAGVDVKRGRMATDFGQGFYTTTVESQAYSRGRQVARLFGGRPAVIRFEVDRDALAELEILCFVRGSPDAHDFWSFVSHCRDGGHHSRQAGDWYDVVIGPVAKNWDDRELMPDADQISFHTTRAAAVLDAASPRRIR